VLAKDELLQFLVLLREEDVVLEQRQEVPRSQKVLTFVSRFPFCSCFQLKMLRRSRFQVTP
jgi:hypothetical protein